MARIRTRVRLSHLLVTLKDGRTIPLPYQDILPHGHMQFDVSESARAANPDLPKRVPRPTWLPRFFLERVIRRSYRRHGWNHGPAVSVKCHRPGSMSWTIYLILAFVVFTSVHIAVTGSHPRFFMSRRHFDGPQRAVQSGAWAVMATCWAGFCYVWGRAFGFNPLSRHHVSSLNVSLDGVEAVYRDGTLIYRSWADRIRAPRFALSPELAFGGERPVIIACEPRPLLAPLVKILDPLFAPRVRLLDARKEWRRLALRGLRWQLPLLVIGLGFFAWLGQWVPRRPVPIEFYMNWVVFWAIISGMFQFTNYASCGPRGGRIRRLIRLYVGGTTHGISANAQSSGPP